MADQPSTIPRLLVRAAERFGAAEAISDLGVSVSFTELLDSTLEVARSLAALGTRPADRVAIWAPNSHLWMRAMLGAHTAGNTVVPINTRYRGEEAREILQRTTAKVVFIDSSFLSFDYIGALVDVDDEVGVEARGNLLAIIDVAPDATAVAATGDRPAVLPWTEFLDLAEQTPLEAARSRAMAVLPTDLSEILFTSGTTGRAKGVKHQHGPAIELYDVYGRTWGLRQGDRYLISLPMFHAGGKSGILTCLIHGLTAVPMAVFEPVAMMKLIETERVSVMNGPPTVIFSLLDHPDRASYDLSSLRTSATGAAVVPVAMVERVQTELPFEHFITAYGLTECYGTATMCRLEDTAETIANTNGKALPGITVRVIDGDGNDCVVDETGEVLVKGNNVTPGYWDTPEQTIEAIRDGWLHTGDVGSLDKDGNLKITDRLKDLFLVGGFNVSPAEIEQLLVRHPAIAEVTVIGVPDERLGEVARAYVIVRPGTEISESDIISWSRERIANFKVPRSVVFVDSFPRTASGKVLKGDLRGASVCPTAAGRS